MGFWIGFFAGFGVCFGLVVLLAVAVDLEFMRAGITTISRRTWVAGLAKLWVAVLVTGILAWVSGALCGHFFLSMTP